MNETNLKRKIKPLSLEQTIILYNKEKSIGLNYVAIHSIDENNNISDEEKINYFSHAPVHLHIFQNSS